MSRRPSIRVCVVAPSRPITVEQAETVRLLASAGAARRLSLDFHPQCFVTDNHFAGPDALRLQAFVEAANDPDCDAVWFARGGYGAGRIAAEAVSRLGASARTKQYLGYSDAGYLLAGLYRAGFSHLAHGPMPGDLRRSGGAAAVARALSFLAGEDEGVEPSVNRLPAPVVAFNLTVLAHTCGTGLAPDLSGHILYLEDVGEYHYRLDRAFSQVMSQPWAPRLAGLRLGRCEPIPVDETDVSFGLTEEEIAKHWCAKLDVPFLGRADIGHDVDNKIVPFGRV
ncbi:MAG: LD-carboxypeptidase [Alphaproteobacteria bacterium]|jgi:muramoyltetrapeptide carboxypeptidase|nr:LD-carboxypeptidase [Alphaproteobacteria bacterium]